MFCFLFLLLFGDGKAYPVKRKYYNPSFIHTSQIKVTSHTRPTKQSTLFATPQINVGIYNIPGTDPDRPNKINQDSYFHFHSKQITYVGVLDGHGLKGHLVSNYFASQIPFHLQTQNQPNLTQSLIDAFEQSHEDAIQNQTIPAGRSGTTCVMCAIEILETSNKLNHIRLYFANVGDSRAILGIPVSTTFHNHIQTNDTQWNSFSLTKETTTQIPDEKLRVDEGEGRIDSMGNVFYGPVGIAMTRALGDAVMLRAGIIPTPVIDSYDLTFSSKENDLNGMICVLGTDGIFDVLTNQEVIDMAVSSYHDNVQSIAKHIVNQAKIKWQAGLPMDVKSDDMTCALIRIN